MKKKIWFSLFVSAMYCAFLWIQSDSPPYGYPDNESSNYYWGYAVDIAHKFRNWHFPFWDKTICCGMSLFTSGQYPILNPTNLTALFLNDDQFYLFKLIEPFFFGCFFMTLLMIDVFKVRKSIAVFSALAFLS